MRPRLTVILASAIIMLAVSVLGVTRGVRASAAYILYHHACYGKGSGSISDILSSSAIAGRHYPYNYYFAIFAAESAYYEALRTGEGDEREYLMRAADYWCEKGLFLNPYKSQLRIMRARLMAKRDPAAAADYWRDYVDWHYWEPFNHSALAEFYAMAGSFDEAFKALETIKGREHYEDGLRRINKQWRREMAMPEF
jgi:hypothetical protein